MPTGGLHSRSFNISSNCRGTDFPSSARAALIFSNRESIKAPREGGKPPGFSQHNQLEFRSIHWNYFASKQLLLLSSLSRIAIVSDIVRVWKSGLVLITLTAFRPQLIVFQRICLSFFSIIVGSICQSWHLAGWIILQNHLGIMGRISEEPVNNFS